MYIIYLNCIYRNIAKSFVSQVNYISDSVVSSIKVTVEILFRFRIIVPDFVEVNTQFSAISVDFKTVIQVVSIVP
ncbi:hypothetical protein D3C85_1061760 [compost metagenome]